MDLQELITTARLAHLNVSNDELAATLPAFEQMIGFFAAMEEAVNDTAFSQKDDVFSIAHAQLVNAEHFRTDEDKTDAESEVDHEFNQKMLNNAAERNGSFIVIPNVL